MYPCRACGKAFQVATDGLDEIRPLTADLTTELAVPPDVRYLAVWRFLAAVDVRETRSGSGAEPSQVWQGIRRLAAPEPPFLYVPAFVFSRAVVQQLGLALVQAQPRLDLHEGLPREAPPGLRTANENGAVSEEDWAPEAGFGTLSPVLLTRDDAEVVAHFVYLALESRSIPDLRSIDYDLALTGGDLLFLPAVYDVRQVRDSNWRLLLREFDGLVA
ncbi:MAG TPA: hypothetical protein VFD74_03725 [Thermoleophilia bacterium]|nr:hypothetical protein [Thermoleophilia bacterium]